MAVIETWFEQDLQKPVKVHYIDGNLFSHNGNGNRIGVVVTNNGEPVTLTGSVSGYAVLADGTTVPCTGTRSGNKASILVPAAAYSPGSILISIFLTDGTTVTTLAALSSSVIMARTGNQIDPGSVVTDWTNTINAAMQSVETAAANLGNIVATPYANLTFPVPLGKYIIYNNGLYRCISPIASSEAWTAAHWTNVKLGDEVTELKSAITKNGQFDSKTATLFADELQTYASLPYKSDIWTIGAILENGGTNSNIPNSAKNNAANIRLAVAGDKITAAAGWLIQVVGMKQASYSPVGTRYMSGFSSSFIVPDDGYVAVNVMKEDGSTITDANAAGANVGYYRRTSKLDTLSTAVAALTNDINNNVKPTISTNAKDIDRLKLNETGIDYVGNEWVRGVAGTNKTVTTSATWGLACTELLSYSRPIRITVASGYRFFLRYYNSSEEYTSSSAWSTTFIDVPKNQKFMITVAKYPEDVSTNASLNWYKHITIPTALSQEVLGISHDQWNNKAWYAFGTSISDTTFPMPYDLGGYTGKYPPYLAALSGLIHSNYAIGGSRISDSATADRNTVVQQLQNTDLTGADLITIDGLVNDWTHSTPIGTFDDTTDSTIYGALYLCVNEIASQNPNATIVLFTDSTGKRWTTPGGTEHPAHVAYYDKNSLGLYQSDYIQAMKKFAEHVGILCIDSGEISQINSLHPQYLQDQIHHSALGGEQFANAIWSILKNIKPNAV